MAKKTGSPGTSAVALFQQAGEAMASSSPAGEKVKKLCEEHQSVSDIVKGLEEDLARNKTRLNVIKTQELPEAMSAVGTTEWKDEAAGCKVTVGTFVAGSLPKSNEDDDAKRQDAIEYLASLGGENLIQSEISLTFSKDQYPQFEKALKAIQKANIGEPSVGTTVNAMSLAAFVRELLEDGQEVDVKRLGLFNGRTAKVSIIKPKASKKKE